MGFILQCLGLFMVKSRFTIAIIALAINMQTMAIVILQIIATGIIP